MKVIQEENILVLDKSGYICKCIGIVSGLWGERVIARREGRISSMPLRKARLVRHCMYNTGGNEFTCEACGEYIGHLLSSRHDCTPSHKRG